MTEIKSRLSDYSEREFTALVQAIKEGEGGEDHQSNLIAHLNAIAADAGGSDLIYYPEEQADNSAEGITQTVKQWCAAQGLPGFKDI